MKNGFIPEVVIIFKCTKCGFEDPMPEWLAEEILPKERFGFKRVYRNNCIKCESEMYPKDFLEKQK